jgi:small subunit ribosomal protein S20
MPQHKGAVRRVRLSEKRRIENKGQKVTLRKMLKAFSGAETAEGLKGLQSSLDKLAKKGLIHKNFAANKKSQLAKAVAKAKAGA